MSIEECLADLRNKLRMDDIGPAVQSYMHSRIIHQFSELRKGGTARGVTWEPFRNPWYTRSDGVSVPITGGVRWMNDPKRKVKGKLRTKNPEGAKRYTSGSALMQSTGMMRAALLSDIRISETGITLDTPVKYAVYQNSLRPWAYITPEEAAEINSMIARRLA